MMMSTTWITGTGNDYPMMWQYSDGSNNNRWNLYYKQSTATLGADAYTGGVLQGSFSSIFPTSGSARTAMAQGANSTNLAINGAIQTLDASWTPPPISILSLGSSYSTRWLLSTKYYPLRVADAQLQLLSQ